jgi:hypothetical protein
MFGFRLVLKVRISGVEFQLHFFCCREFPTTESAFSLQRFSFYFKGTLSECPTFIMSIMHFLPEKIF